MTKDEKIRVTRVMDAMKRWLKEIQKDPYEGGPDTEEIQIGIRELCIARGEHENGVG